MARRSSLTTVLAMSLALVATALGTAPAAAERILNESGTWGYYEFHDTEFGQKGAKCIYETSGISDLDKIRVRPPLMHGNYSNKTKVDWRFKIRREPPSSMTWHVIYTSPWQADTANDAIPADDFTWRTWIAPENPTGFFQVIVQLRWWHYGAVEGRVKAQIEWYKAIRGNDSYRDNEYCLKNY